MEETKKETPEMGDRMEVIESLVMDKLIESIKADYDGGVDRYGRLLVDLLHTKAALMKAYGRN
jgi:hypothetical protein